MDPIKVDFTGGGADKGPDKKTGVVIPPERKGLKIIINIILTLVFGGIIYYIVITFVLWLGLPANDLKLLSALVVALFLGIPYWKSKIAEKRVKPIPGGASNA